MIYDKGLGTHAPADVEYYLGGSCSTVQADVGGAHSVHLVVTDYDGTNNSDHADWGDARVTCAGT